MESPRRLTVFTRSFSPVFPTLSCHMGSPTCLSNSSTAASYPLQKSSEYPGAVSYTHLDVYKRQYLHREPTIQKIHPGCRQLSHGERAFWVVCREAAFGIDSLYEDVSARETNSIWHRRSELQGNDLSHNKILWLLQLWVCMAERGAVSYTHLDVYKRQGRHRHIVIFNGLIFFPAQVNICGRKTAYDSTIDHKTIGHIQKQPGICNNGLNLRNIVQ